MSLSITPPLREGNCFIVWKYGPAENGKPTKLPFNPNSPQWKAKSNDPKTWSTSEKALKVLKTNGFEGIGRVLTRDDRFSCVDLDHCRNSITGEIEAWAWEIILLLNSYTEISPSGEGVHIWVKVDSKSDVKKRKKGNVEIFWWGFYLTMTGNHLENTSTTIEDRQGELEALERQIFIDEDSGENSTPAAAGGEYAAYAQRALADELAKLARTPETDRNNQLNRSAFALGQLVGAGILDPGSVKAALYGVAVSIGLTESETRSTVRSGIEAGEKEPRQLPEREQPRSTPRNEAPDPEQDYDRLEREAIKSEEPEKPKFLGGILEINQLASIEVPERKKYLDPWLMESSINMLCGPPGIGKTMFGFSMAEAAARAGSLGPWKGSEPVNVLYLDGELVLSDLQERANYFRQDSYPSKFYVYSTHQFNLLGLPNANLSDDTWQKEVTDLLKYLNIKLWFIDNIASLSPGIDENLKHLWDPINQWFLKLRFAGISTVFLHHTGKENKQRGTSGREDNIDISIILDWPKGYHKEDGCRFVAKFEKARIRQRDLHLIADTEFSLEVDEHNAHTWTYKNVKLGNKKAILEMLDQGTAQKDIAETLSLDKGYVSRIKSQAEKDGHLAPNGKLSQSGYVFVHGAIF